jgi:hypothetical protein
MSDEEPRSQGESKRPFSHKRALHNLLGMADEARKDVSYARTTSLVGFLSPTLRLIDDEEPARDEASFRRGMTTEPHQTASIPVQSVTGARARFEHRLDSCAIPQKVGRQDPLAEDVVIISAPRMVPAPAPERQDGQPAIKAEESDRTPRVNRARESLSGGLSILRPAVERPAGVQSAPDGEPSAPEKRATAGAEPAPTRGRGAEPRRHIEYAAGGDSAAVENLRRTVKELTAKMAQSYGRTQQATSHTQPDTTPATAPPPAPQRAVINSDQRWPRRPSGRAERSGPARAFWQRNYLARRSF